MTRQSRDNILSALYAPQDIQDSQPETAEAAGGQARNLEQRIEILKSNLEAVRGEVHVADSVTWVSVLKEIVLKRNLLSLLYSPFISLGKDLEENWEAGTADLPGLVAYENDIEEFKEDLFDIDASITSTWGAIAENGSIILWPDKKEPRLMSLVPPIHIAVLEAKTIHDGFADVLRSDEWKTGMPTNAVLISGPSKTADVELVLAFGVHGPKELITIIIQ